MSHNETSGPVRIRTDDGNEWRFDAIQETARFYDCNQPIKRPTPTVTVCSRRDV